MINTERIKQGLLAKLKELEERAEDIEEELSATPDADWDDNAIESEDDEVLAGIGDLTLNDIRSIKSAISRIDQGLYGICSSCGQTIPDPRLKVLPHTTKCVKCT